MKRIVLALLIIASAQAATVSSITCAGQTATFSATAHGLTVSQGYVLTGTAGTFIWTVSTASANSFTSNVSASGTACSTLTSGYTSVAPLRQIIPISTVANPQTGMLSYSYLEWFTTLYPTPVAGFQSAVPGVTNAELAALQAGGVVEVSDAYQVGAAPVTASVVVASNVGTVTTSGPFYGTVTLMGSSTSALNGTYTVQSTVPGGVTITTSGVSNGTYANAGLVAYSTPTSAYVQAIIQGRYANTQAQFAGYLLAQGYCYYGAATGWQLCTSGQ